MSGDRVVNFEPARIPNAAASALLLLSACSSGETPDGGNANKKLSSDLEEKVEALNEIIPVLMERRNIPGLSIALVHDGDVVWTNAYGVISTESEAPVTTDTTFEAASLSKPVFALAVLNAVERGTLDLDAPISEQFSYKRFAPDERVNRITPRMILSHKTGLPNWDRDGALDFDREPGTQFGYSGEGFVYLQKALETITGRSLNDFAGEVVFKLFGMKDSSFIWREDYETRLASGQDSENAPAERNRYAEENAAYSLVTTASDYGAFLAGILKGANLNGDVFNDMLAVHTSMQGDETATKYPPEVWRKIHWGLSWGVQESNDERVYFHWGDNDVYHSFVAFSPTRDIGFVYFSNSQNGLKIANNIAEIVVGDMTPAIAWLGYGGLDAAEAG